MRIALGASFAVLLAAAGCQTQTADTTAPAAAPANTPIRTTGTAAAGLELSPLDVQAAPAAAPSTPAPSPAAALPGGPGGSAPPAPPSTATTPPTEKVKAAAGVGARGQSLKEHTGVLVEPAKAFFRVEQSVVFNVQIPKAIDLFKATEGRHPRSQDEFMTRIIAENQIQLPRLPAGHKYIYNPESGELMVERPAK